MNFGVAITSFQAGLANGLFSFCVKDMDIVHVEFDLGLLAKAQLGARIDAGDEGVLAADQVKQDFIAHQLGHIHFDIDTFSIDILRV